MSGRAELERRVYERYASFFDEAERERRWNPFRDIPWERANREASPALVLCAETFCAVESYLPDYVSKGINAVKESFGQAWFAANWAYEESKHSIALMEYLIRAGHRTLDQMLAMQAELRQREWQLPFATARQMTLYGVLQEMATFFIYCRQEARAHAEHDEALRTIFRLAARDEIAHTRFYQDVIRLLLAEDRDGVLADMAFVVQRFEMPGVRLVPDYDARVAVMRQGGVDRDTFLQKVYFPVLKYLGVERRELVLAARAGSARGGASAVAPSEAQP